MPSHNPFQRLKIVEKRLRRRRLLQILPQTRLKDIDNPLEKYNATEFKERFHIFKETAFFIVDIIRSEISCVQKRGVFIPPIVQFLLVQRFYVTGSMQLVLADLSNVSQPSVSRIIKRVSVAVAKQAQKFIKFPTFAEAGFVANGFYRVAKFPGVVGCIDCTHVPIRSPGGKDAELFRNRKQTFSLNVQAVCDQNLNFTNVIARWYGSAHDMRIFEDSNLSLNLEMGKVPGILLGDSGYACLPYLMTPILSPVTPSELRYNKAQLSTRNMIERAFGVWKRRFPCLTYSRLKISTLMTVIVATAVVHNIARRRIDIFQNDEPGTSPRNEEQVVFSANHSTLTGRAKRQEIIQTSFVN